MTLSFFFSKFGYDCRSCVYCKVLFHYTVPVWKSTLLVIGIWNIIYWGPQSQQPMLFLLYHYFMGSLILVSVHNFLAVTLPCLFGEVKLCQAGLVLGWVRPYFDFKFIFQKKAVSLFFHCFSKESSFIALLHRKK